MGPQKKIGPIIPSHEFRNCSKAGKSQKLKDLCGLASSVVGLLGGFDKSMDFQYFQNPNVWPFQVFRAIFVVGPGINPQHTKESGALQPKKNEKCHLDNPWRQLATKQRRKNVGSRNVQNHQLKKPLQETPWNNRRLSAIVLAELSTSTEIPRSGRWRRIRFGIAQRVFDQPGRLFMTCLWLFGMDCSDVSWRSETHGKTTLANSFRQLASLGVSKMHQPTTWIRSGTSKSTLHQRRAKT